MSLSVTLSQNTKGGTWSARFKDPRVDKKLVARSLETKDFDFATKARVQIEEIISNGTFDDPPTGTLDIVLKVLRIKLKDKEAYDSVNESFWNSTQDQNPHDLSVQDLTAQLGITVQDYPCIEDKDFVLALQVYIMSKLQELTVLKSRLTYAQSETLQERERADAMQAQLVAIGKEKLEGANKSLKDAIDDFLSDDPAKRGSKAGPRWKVSIRGYLEAFKKKLGEDTLIKHLEPGQVIKYLANKLKRAQPRSVKQQARQILRLLSHTTYGSYPTGKIKEWLKVNCSSAGKTEFYWPERAEVEKLVSKIQELHGPYWADIAQIQYATGVRPEELPYLQCSRVTKNEKGYFIFIGALYDSDGKIVWTTKNAQSQQSVYVPTMAHAALERRLEQKDLVLFSRRHDPTGSKFRKLEKQGEFFNENQLWKVEAFCKHYITVLRQAAQAIGIDSLKYDSRTLRRTCGKEVLTRTNSYERAAAVLRNDPDTCRRWYAQFKAADVIEDR